MWEVISPLGIDSGRITGYSETDATEVSRQRAKVGLDPGVSCGLALKPGLRVVILEEPWIEEMNMGNSKRAEIWRLRRRARGMPDEAHPSHSDRVVILGCGAVMLRESLNSLHHARERLLWWKMTGIDPSQADVLTVVEHLFGDPERFECFAEILIGPIRWMHQLRLGRGCLFQLRTFPTLSDYTIP